MQRRNIQRLVIGIALVIIASGGLYITLQRSGDNITSDGQQLRNPENMPMIERPGLEAYQPGNVVQGRGPETKKPD